MTTNAAPLRMAVIGGGWAGMAAAVRAVQAGHQVTVFEAARRPGAVVDEVPVGGATHLGPQGPGGVLAHGWHPHAVGDLQGSDGDGFEETRAGHGARLRPPPRPHPARNRAPHLPAAGRPHPPPAAPAALVSRGTD